MGRSRGGWGTKLHLLTDGTGLPLAVKLSAGQAHEAPYAESLLDSVRVRRPSGAVRRRPERVAGDKGYSYDHIRQWLRQHHIKVVIPERSDQLARRRGRRSGLDASQYGRRNVVERCVGWLKQARAVATRFEKLAVHYIGTLKLAIIRQYLKLALSNTT